ncbi:RidA family protein [Palleronia sp. LCG004]|uniref:RidA family protein n=1 Tax=Palleronia sp. LCG004 TaxID=3079304 RepID=UPI002941EE65|nr:RidA family protein [Palleronia sp. LCG004]WOI58239.1 RidA family protein [Palleronia sp. LCG004]
MIERKVQTAIHHRIAIHNGVVYIGGLVASDKSKDMAGQTQEICDKLDELLAEAGTSKDNILQAMIYSSDFSQKDALNKVWTDWIAPEHLPTRAFIGGADLSEGILVEIVVTAAL